MMNLIRLDSVGSVFDTSDLQVYPQLVDGLPDLGMGVDMYDVDIEWISSLSDEDKVCLLYTSPSPRDRQKSRMPSSA